MFQIFLHDLRADAVGDTRQRLFPRAVKMSAVIGVDAHAQLQHGPRHDIHPQSVLQIIPRKPLGRIGHKQRGVRLAGEDLLRAFLRRADHGKLHVRPYT